MISTPFFIVGAARSGTTLFAMMLNSHSRIAIPYESHFIPDYYRRRESLGDLKNNANDRINLVNSILAEPFVARWDKRVEPGDVDTGKCTSLEETIDQIYTAYARKHSKPTWGDKTPAHISEIHILNRMFPSAKFIHIIRDGRDVALSFIKRSWGISDFMTALTDWEQKVDCARKVLCMLPETQRMDLRFEDLVSSPEAEIRRVTDFLGIDFEERMIESYCEKAPGYVGKLMKIHPHLSERPSSAQAFKWVKSLHPADQAIAFDIAGELLKELGYPEGVRNHSLKRFRKLYHLLVQITRKPGVHQMARKRP